MLFGWAALAIHAVRTRSSAFLTVSVAGAFGAGGALLAAHAWQQAWRPPLRLLFEAMTPDARTDLQRAGRPVPVDVSVPMVLVGVLRSDASVNDSGLASLSIDVEWAGRLRGSNGSRDAATNPAAGGALLTVLGTMGPDRVGEWTAGRRIRAPAELRRAARYLNPGVPDEERVLARRGVTLVGTVKSAALVEVLARGSPAAELASGIESLWPPRYRRVCQTSQPPLRRHRQRHRPWRPHRARRRGAEKAAGGRHVSRDRDLWWKSPFWPPLRWPRFASPVFWGVRRC